jgi:methyltransferase (TIGR00027 family)
VTQEPALSGVHLTAVHTAAVRAVHLLQDGEPKVMRDELALALSGLSVDQALATATLTRQALSTMYTTWICRGRFAEDRLALARARGVGQYVVLGAGLDSFALRQGDGLGDLIVYEVDDPSMQEWKRWRLDHLGLRPPPGLRFVPCDFETRDVRDALAAAGFDAGAPAFVSWLGVTQYLTRQAIRETLLWAAALAAGSEIVVAYLVPSPEADAMKARLAQNGTRFATFFEPEEMDALLGEVGFRVEQVSPDDLDDLYFRDRVDGLRAPTGERLIIGRVG